MNIPTHIADYIIKTQTEIIAFGKTDEGKITRNGLIASIVFSALIIIAICIGENQ